MKKKTKKNNSHITLTSSWNIFIFIFVSKCKLEWKIFFHNSSPEIFQFMWSCKNWKHYSKYINNFWKLLQVWMLLTGGTMRTANNQALWSVGAAGIFLERFYKFKKYNKDSVKFKITVPILRCEKQSIGIIIFLDLHGKPSILSASNICVFFTIPLAPKPQNMLKSNLLCHFFTLDYYGRLISCIYINITVVWAVGWMLHHLKLVETCQCHHSKGNSILL